MADVQIRNLKKSYEKFQVMHGIDIDIADKSFVALVGPSGCGKSTLLRMIAGLEDVTSGDIRIGDQRINDLAPKERDIAMVFQNYALYPHMTVEENMGFALKMSKVPPEKIKAQVKEAAEILNLTDYLDRYPRNLSGGQRQRVAMGRCIVRHPEVFLFDEPLSNLDAKLRVKMRSEIKSLHQRLNATSIYVTHDQIEAMTMADQIVVMRAGRIEQMGAPLELYDFPANIFVATFIGSPAINLVKGTIVDRGDRLALALGKTELSTDLTDRGYIGKSVTAGIRPEHLDLSDAPTGLPVVVDVVEGTGNETIVTATLFGEEIQLSLRDRHAFPVGSTIHVQPRPGRIHLFDTETEARIA